MTILAIHNQKVLNLTSLEHEMISLNIHNK